jgi:uncharacterized protein YuzE
MNYIILQDGHVIIDGLDLGDFIWIIDNDGTFANVKFGNVEQIHRIEIFNNDVEASLRQYVVSMNGVITYV